MADDDGELGFGEKAFDELLRLGKWILARRKLERSDVFDRDVDAVLEDLDKVHTDFLRVLVASQDSISKLVDAQVRGSNAVSDLLDHANLQIAEAKETLEQGRIGRRHLYERCLARYVDLNSADEVQVLKRAAYFGDQEIELLLRFLEALLSYFRTEAKAYNHEMRNLLNELEIEIDQANREGLDEESRRRLEQASVKLVEKEQDFVANWSAAVGLRYELELKLK